MNTFGKQSSLLNLTKGINFFLLCAFIVLSFISTHAENFCTFTLKVAPFSQPGCDGSTTGAISVSCSPGGDYVYVIGKNGLPIPGGIGSFTDSTIIFGIPAGDYDIEVAAAAVIAQCQAFFSLQVPTVSATTPIIVLPGPCICDGEITIQVTGTQNLVAPIRYTYILQGDNGYSNSIQSSDTIETFGNLCGGNYTWTVQASDSSPIECSVSTSGTLQFNGGGPTPIPSISGNTTYNAGSPAELFGNPSGADLTYSWTTPTNVYTTQDINFTANANTAGRYILKVCNPANGGECCGSVTTHVIVNPGCTLAVDFETITNACQGQNNGVVQVSSTGNPPFSYQLDTTTTGTATSNPFLLSGLSGGSHTLAMTDSSNPPCNLPTTSFNVPVTCCLQATSSNNIPSCAQSPTGSVDITVSGQTGTVSYSTDNGASYNPVTANPFTVPELPAGPITILVGDASVPPCNPVSVTTSIGTRPSPSVAITGNMNVCGTTTPTLTASGSGGAGAPYTYIWADGTNSAQIAVTGPGNYSVTVTDAAGCTGVNSVMVNADFSAGVTPASAALCPNESVVLTAVANPLGSGYKYSWACCGSPEVLSTQSTVLATAPGTYEVTITDAEFPECSGTAPAKITAQSNCINPVVSIGCPKKTSPHGHTKVTITITNGGTGPLTNLAINDILPYCFTFKGAVSKNGIWTLTPGAEVSARYNGTLEPGKSTSMTLCLQAHCPKNSSHPFSVINNVTVTGDGFNPRTASCAIALD